MLSNIFYGRKMWSVHTYFQISGVTTGGVLGVCTPPIESFLWKYRRITIGKNVLFTFEFIAIFTVAFCSYRTADVIKQLTQRKNTIRFCNIRRLCSNSLNVPWNSSVWQLLKINAICIVFQSIHQWWFGNRLGWMGLKFE